MRAGHPALFEVSGDEAILNAIKNAATAHSLGINVRWHWHGLSLAAQSMIRGWADDADGGDSQSQRIVREAIQAAELKRQKESLLLRDDWDWHGVRVAVMLEHRQTCRTKILDGDTRISKVCIRGNVLAVLSCRCHYTIGGSTYKTLAHELEKNFHLTVITDDDLSIARGWSIPKRDLGPMMEWNTDLAPVLEGGRHQYYDGTAVLECLQRRYSLRLCSVCKCPFNYEREYQLIGSMRDVGRLAFRRGYSTFSGRYAWLYCCPDCRELQEARELWHQAKTLAKSMLDAEMRDSANDRRELREARAAVQMARATGQRQ